jgi:hypothetical protein
VEVVGVVVDVDVGLAAFDNVVISWARLATCACSCQMILWSWYSVFMIEVVGTEVEVWSS